jgi:hypothetical protein
MESQASNPRGQYEPPIFIYGPIPNRRTAVLTRGCEDGIVSINGPGIFLNIGILFLV